MPAMEGQIAAIRLPIDAVRADFGTQRSAGGSLSSRQNAVAPSALNRGGSRASDGDCAGPARHQPGRRRHALLAHAGRWLARRCAAADPLAVGPAGPTGALIARGAGLATGTRTNR
jgi:hypothetical protein